MPRSDWLQPGQYESIPNYILVREDLPPNAKLIYAVLLGHFLSESPVVWPSIETIRARVGSSRKTVTTCLALLEARGLIETAGRRHHVTMYRILPPPPDGVQSTCPGNGERQSSVISSSEHGKSYAQSTSGEAPETDNPPTPLSEAKGGPSISAALAQAVEIVGASYRAATGHELQKRFLRPLRNEVRTGARSLVLAITSATITMAITRQRAKRWGLTWRSIMDVASEESRTGRPAGNPTPMYDQTRHREQQRDLALAETRKANRLAAAEFWDSLTEGQREQWLEKAAATRPPANVVAEGLSRLAALMAWGSHKKADLAIVGRHGHTGGGSDGGGPSITAARPGPVGLSAACLSTVEHG